MLVTRKEALETANLLLGHLGRLICYSKGRYRKENPKDLIVFNANVCTEDHGKIWYGDLNLTNDYLDLMDLSQRIGCEVYVLYESDARFDREHSPKLKDYVAMISAVKIKLLEQPLKTKDLKGNVVTAPNQFYLDITGVPRVYTIEQHKKLYPSYYKAIKAVKAKLLRDELALLKANDYIEVKIGIRYAVTKDLSPLDQLQKKVISLCKGDKEKAQALYDSLLWTRKERKAFEKASIDWIKRQYPDVDKYEIDKTLAYASLDAPRNFYPADPKWATGRFYIKKDSK
jgi:hypothetical protein